MSIPANECWEPMEGYPHWITESGISLANVVPAFKRLLCRPNIKDVILDCSQECDPEMCYFDAKCFFGMLEATFQNNNVRKLRIAMPRFFQELEGKDEIIESISAHVEKRTCKIKELELSIFDCSGFEHSDLFVKKVIVNLVELEKLSVEVTDSDSRFERTNTWSSLLAMGKLKTFELKLTWPFPDDSWPTVLAPLAQPSSLKTLKIDSEEAPLHACRAELMRILVQSNTTLEAITFSDENFRCLCAPLKFYLVLNRFGRGQCRDPNVTMPQLIHNLVSVQNWNTSLRIPKCYRGRCPCPKCPCNINRPAFRNVHHPHPHIPEKARVTSYLYEFLRACPSKWSTDDHRSGALLLADDNSQKVGRTVRERRAKRKEPPPES